VEDRVDMLVACSDGILRVLQVSGAAVAQRHESAEWLARSRNDRCQCVSR
jgi:hypothetical protein